MLASAENSWKNVKIGGGGVYVPNIIYNQTQPGLGICKDRYGGMLLAEILSLKVGYPDRLDCTGKMEYAWW